MSYRSFKRLLGETSLERKCRFLFGGGLMLLIAGSFYFYARLNSKLLREQNLSTARMLITPILIEKHWQFDKKQQEFFQAAFTSFERKGELKPEDLREYRWQIVSIDPKSAEAAERPADDAGYEALMRIRRGESEVVNVVSDRDEYNYYTAVRAAQSCIKCHNTLPGKPQIAEDDLMAVVKVTLPLEETERALAWNNAILLATAIVTAFLAMLAAYAIVRYVIVKPVLHLKDVSDGIARGTLDLRADIRTGDEFEELSHAFNRMLRHLVTVQDELREVNTDLDGKVDELARVNLRLYEMNKLKDEFLATMSHELRTPLNSILGFSDILAGAANLNDRQKRYVANILASGQDLMARINDILDLAKIESGKMAVQPTEFDLGELIDKQVARMLPVASKKNIELTQTVDASLPDVFQDRGKLQQILDNLLSNAVKFTPEGGRVRVRVQRASAETFDLVVDDTGIGIPLEDQERIFEKFRQGDAILGDSDDAAAREFEGTGLGLSIVKELAKLLGGEITLESEFGKGSTFAVRLPIHCDADAEGSEADPFTADLDRKIRKHNSADDAA